MISKKKTQSEKMSKKTCFSLTECEMTVWKNLLWLSAHSVIHLPIPCSWASTSEEGKTQKNQREEEDTVCFCFCCWFFFFLKSQDYLIGCNANLSFLKLMPSGYVIFHYFFFYQRKVICVKPLQFILFCSNIAKVYVNLLFSVEVSHGFTFY